MPDGGRQDFNAGGDNVIHGPPREDELLNFAGMPSQSVGDALSRPTEAVAGFDGHQAMDRIRQDGGRGEPLNVLLFHAIQEALTGRPVNGMRDNGVDEDVGVQKDGSACRDVGERHSSGAQRWLSSDSARYSRSSWVPFHRRPPPKRLAAPPTGWMVRVTFCPSGRGKACAGLKTPFS